MAETYPRLSAAVPKLEQGCRIRSKPATLLSSLLTSDRVKSSPHVLSGSGRIVPAGFRGISPARFLTSLMEIRAQRRRLRRQFSWSAMHHGSTVQFQPEARSAAFHGPQLFALKGSGNGPAGDDHQYGNLNI